MTRKAVTRAFAIALTSGLVAAGCGDSSTETGSGPTGGDPRSGLVAAQEAVAKAKQGTSRPVDPTPRAAVKGKKVAVISAAQFVSSSQIPADATKAAAEAIGWSATVYDGENKPARFPELVRQAVAAQVDAIVLVAVDCQTTKPPLQEAKAAGIAITSVYAFDCSDPKAGAEPEGLFSVNTNFGPTAADIDAFTKRYGADQGNYIIAESNNTAKVIAVNAPEFTVLNWTYDGFKEAIERSGGTELVSTLEVTTNDLATGVVDDKIQAELQRHPEATWLKSPFTFITTLGVAPALGAQAGKVKVMGGEGFKDELDLMRQDPPKVNAVNYISSEWNGWAAIDSLNSYFLKQAPADSGIGWTIVDKDNGLPPEGEIQLPVDFKAAYRKAWGVG